MSVVTVAELRLGVLLAGDVVSRSTRLATLQLAEALEPLPIDDRVGAAWARLVATLRAVGPKTTGSPASSPTASEEGTATTATIAPKTRSERSEARS